jgi:flagellar biogenesis protein FliO
MAAFLRRILGDAVLGGRPRRMKLCETLSLGEKRFVAIVQVDAQQFLIGSGGLSFRKLATDPAAGQPGKGNLPYLVQTPREKDILESS